MLCKAGVPWVTFFLVMIRRMLYSDRIFHEKPGNVFLLQLWAPLGTSVRFQAQEHIQKPPPLPGLPVDLQACSTAKLPPPPRTGW